jgi:endonuclease/exonuclease/phosphatase (EEP) superfamily protein YafD
VNWRLTLQIAGGLLVVFSLIPLIRHDYWTFRVFEYPRAQKFLLTLLVALAYAVFIPFVGWADYAFLGVLVLTTGYLFYQLFPYTQLAPVKLLRTKHFTPERALSLMICNVYQYNRKAADLLDLVRRFDPDLLLLAETDQWWADQTAVLTEAYPETVQVPIDNTYGMLLYSRRRLIDPEVKYLVEAGIPSIHTQVELPSGERIQLYCLHPTPPVPQENPRSTERDKEILLVGTMAKASKIPVIVAGDLNDVAWSYTTELFQKVSGLLDPRRGRGFYNTFHAKIPFLRFPLDHVFCSTDFKLIRIQRLPKCGSDHFPMYIHLFYEPRATLEQEEPEADAEELETAQEKINADTDSDGPARPQKNPIRT